jgi:hypothetical protein
MDWDIFTSVGSVYPPLRIVDKPFTSLPQDKQGRRCVLEKEKVKPS